MADFIKRVDYYYTLVPNHPGEGAGVFGALKAGNINLIAFNGFQINAGRAQLDFVPSDKDAFLAAAQKAGIRLVGPKVAFLVQGEDRVGAVTDILGKLEKAHINVVAMQAIASGTGRYGAILWVKPRNIGRAAQFLGVS